ncbi:bifunctional sulfate adenylyltransferase/adenylylsulfate kinase [Caldithrix abyssi]|nr:bifunctional sulfate adenylyltransferase/adenylylsulfate kinase [Caldithrix abyssi]
MSTELIEPHGGHLNDLIAQDKTLEKLKKESIQYPAWVLNDRQICDLELLLNGGFSPLKGFLNRKDYESVRDRMRLVNGILWPIPITLDVSEDFAKGLSLGGKVTLRDKEGFTLALVTIGDIWKPNRNQEAQAIFGTTDDLHPGVHYLLSQSNPVYIGGKVEGLSLPRHHDYRRLRQTPAEVRKQLRQFGWNKVIAFQTRNPMHQAHVALTKRAAEQFDAHVLIHPVVGLTKPGDVDHFTRVRCYNHVLDHYSDATVHLSLLPLAMRMGGPREALWHAIIRKNYGCSHFIVGRDHAGPGNDKTGTPFYGPYDAQDLLREHEDELGVKMVPFKLMVYVKDEDAYSPVDEVPEGAQTLSISGTDLRNRLDKGLEIPEWFTFPAVEKELRKSRPPLNKRGFTVLFTGFSGSGKSTLANGLVVKLLELGDRPVTLLDGDIVRTHLSSELGFSKEHRSLNVRRIGYVASEITRNGGIAICAPIAPYEVDRRFVRELVSSIGGYMEIHVSTPLSICEERDVKGLYAKARQGILKQFTGIDDPYETPENPEIAVNSSKVPPELLVEEILLAIEQFGYISMDQKIPTGRWVEEKAQKDKIFNRGNGKAEAVEAVI